MENTLDTTNLNTSILNLKSLTSKPKQSGYQAQSWFSQVKSTDKDIVKQLRLLPKLNQSIAHHSETEIAEAQKQKKAMTVQLDSLIYKNKQLEIKLTMLKKKFQNQVEDNTMKDQEIIKKVDDLKAKYSKQYKIYQDTISLQQRYKIVIELCRINRLQNEETMSELNYLLSNYNNMIDHLILQMHKFKDEQKVLKKVNASYQKEKAEQQQNHEEIFSQIKTNLLKKQAFDHRVIENDKFLESSIVDMTVNRSTDNIKETNKFSLVQNEKKSHYDKQVLKDYQEKFARLKELFQFGEVDFETTAIDKLLDQNPVY